MYNNNEDIFYYLTLYNENYPMPAIPKKCEEGKNSGLFKNEELNCVYTVISNKNKKLFRIGYRSK